MPTTRHIRPKQSIREWYADILGRHETLYFLVWKDLKVQYGNFAIGFLWSLFQPVFYFGIIMLLFQSGNRNASDSALAFPLFLFAGIIVWNFLTNSITSSVNSTLSNAQILTKSFFPRFYLILAPIFRCCIDLVISFILLFLLALFFQERADVTAIWAIPFSILLLVVSTLGIAAMAVVAVIRFKRLRQAIPIVLYAGIFLLPVYTEIKTIQNPLLDHLYYCNPYSVAIQLLRSSFSGEVIATYRLALGSTSAILVLAVGVGAFRNLERTLADRV